MTSWNAIWNCITGDVPFRSANGNPSLLGDITGHDMPPVLFSELPLVGQQGNYLSQTRLDAREVTIPIAMRGDAQSIQTFIQSMASKLSPLQAFDTWLELIPTGSVDPGRVLYCKYLSGLEGDLEVFDQDDAWMVCNLVFRAFDPWWYDPADNTRHLVGTYAVTADVVSGSTSLFGPFTAAMAGLGVSGTGIPGGAVIDSVVPGVSAVMSGFGTATNFGVALTISSGLPVGSSFDPGGDGEVPANFYIHGPIVSPVITRFGATTEFLDFSNNGGLTLTNTQSMTITTGRDGRVAIVRDDGTNLLPYLTAASTAFNWRVENVGFAITGSGITADTIIDQIWRARYFTP